MMPNLRCAMAVELARDVRSAFVTADFTDTPVGRSINLMLDALIGHMEALTPEIEEISADLAKARVAVAFGELLPEADKAGVVGAAGLEPATLCLEGKCSIHLSYAPTQNDSNPNSCSACSAGDWRQEYHKHDYPPSESAYNPANRLGRVPRSLCAVDLTPAVPRV
jgi:hypothetical protein